MNSIKRFILPSRVYKDSPFWGKKEKSFRKRFTCPGYFSSICLWVKPSHTPVSYTHLDVYKRQEYIKISSQRTLGFKRPANSSWRDYDRTFVKSPGLPAYKHGYPPIACTNNLIIETIKAEKVPKTITGPAILNMLPPVSYTHLDVYKRQIQS